MCWVWKVLQSSDNTGAVVIVFFVGAFRSAIVDQEAHQSFPGFVRSNVSSIASFSCTVFLSNCLYSRHRMALLDRLLNLTVFSSCDRQWHHLSSFTIRSTFLKPTDSSSTSSRRDPPDLVPRTTERPHDCVHLQSGKCLRATSADRVD